jgi:hypothetical protein
LSPETAVRIYLEYLRNPGSFDNRAQVDALTKKADSASDVLTKLALLRDARSAKRGVGNEFKANFVRYAKAYAESQGLATDDFRALGVPASVLAEAGFVTRGRSPRRTRATAAPAASSNGASGRTKQQLADIRAWANASGYQVADRGRVAAEVIAAYDAAHS